MDSVVPCLQVFTNHNRAFKEYLLIVARGHRAACGATDESIHCSRLEQGELCCWLRAQTAYDVVVTRTACSGDPVTPARLPVPVVTVLHPALVRKALMPARRCCQRPAD